MSAQHLCLGGICDDCGRLVTAEGQQVADSVDIEVPPTLNPLEAIAYAMRQAEQWLSRPRCRTCGQIKKEVTP